MARTAPETAPDLDTFRADTRAWLDANRGIPALRRLVTENLAGLDRALLAQARARA